MQDNSDLAEGGLVHKDTVRPPNTSVFFNIDNMWAFYWRPTGLGLGYEGWAAQAGILWCQCDLFLGTAKRESRVCVRPIYYTCVQGPDYPKVCRGTGNVCRAYVCLLFSEVGVEPC